MAYRDLSLVADLPRSRIAAEIGRNGALRRALTCPRSIGPTARGLARLPRRPLSRGGAALPIAPVRRALSQAIADRGSGEPAGSCRSETFQSLAAALLQPVARLRREHEIPRLRPSDILPAAIEFLPALAGVAVDVSIATGVDVAAPSLADEAPSV